MKSTPSLGKTKNKRNSFYASRNKANALKRIKVKRKAIPFKNSFVNH